MITSWVAVVTLGVFWWVSTQEPILLEIEKGKESKASETLILATIIYLILAVLVTAYRGIFMRGETVTEGVSRLKNDMRRVLKAGETHNTQRVNQLRKDSNESDDPKVVSLGQTFESNRSSDNQNLIG
jgi:hypothetical protein